MKIRFPDSVPFGSKHKLVVELAALDFPASGRRAPSVEVLLIAPGFGIAPKARQTVKMKPGARTKATVSYTLTALDPGDAMVKRQLRADLLVNRVLAASVTSTTIVHGPVRSVLEKTGSHVVRGARRGPVRSIVRRAAPKHMARKKNGGGGGRAVHRAVRGIVERHAAAPAHRAVRSARPAPTEAQSVSREPRIDFHELVEAGKANDLTVRLSDAISQVERERLVTVEIPGGKETVEVAVRLSAPGFVVKPKPEKTLKIGRVFDEKREQMTFTLTANDAGEEPITREIRADFWSGNNCIGAVTHRTQVIPAGYTGPVQPDGSGRSTSFELKDDRQECDLVIIVTSTKEDGKPPYDIHLRSQIPGADYAFRPMGRLSITPTKLSTTLNGVFSQFVSAFPVNGTKKQVAEWRDNMRDAIERLGKYLWGILPVKFRDEYFRLKDAGNLPKSIQVHSDEMLIPWELLIPHRSNGNAQVLKPLGVMHVMGRWRPGLGIQPRPQKMRVQSACIVNPKYPADQQLLWSILEAADLKAALPVFKPLDPPTRAEFKKLLDRSDVQVVHYTGHGKYTAKQADLSSLELQGGDLVDAIDFVAASLLSKGRALVYLNACEAGNVGVVMGQMGGFAVQCLSNGCSGVIAPYWAVVDGTAKDFSLEFYGMLKKGRSIGEALKELRAKHPKDPTFQAFSYFGDPWTQLQF